MLRAVIPRLGNILCEPWANSDAISLADAEERLEKYECLDPVHRLCSTLFHMADKANYWFVPSRGQTILS
jgi:hypothetical protein